MSNQAICARYDISYMKFEHKGKRFTFIPTVEFLYFFHISQPVGFLFPVRQKKATRLGGFRVALVDEIDAIIFTMSFQYIVRLEFSIMIQSNSRMRVCTLLLPYSLLLIT